MNAILEPVGRAVPSPPSPSAVGRTSHVVPASAGPISSLTDHASSTHPSIQSSTDPLEDLAHEFANDEPNVFIKAAINIASVDFFTILNRFDTVPLTKRISEKPELFFQLINSYANLMKVSLEQQKFEHKQKQAEARQREREQKLRARKPILITASTITSILSSVGRPVPSAPSSKVGRGIPAEPHTGRASVPASQEPSHVVPALAGPVSVPSVPSVLNDPAPVDPELAQIVANEFATADTDTQRDSWQDHNHDEETEDVLIPCPS